ncbi:MAG TPA: hypothetical protein VN783_07435 [Thermoanaerobaculia bacterium]|nr:hypothetical protein [Thermoanaerobaculia bacterium]
MSVTYTSIEEGIPLPFGADRGLLAWIQTRAFDDGFVRFDALAEYFQAFGLDQGGREYTAVRQRIRRLGSLAISITLESELESARLQMHPLKKIFLPKDGSGSIRPEVGRVSPQLLLIRRRYGFDLDPDLWALLRRHPVPQSLALLGQFHNRPKAWDFVSFVLYRCFAARCPTVVPWNELVQQLGSTDRTGHRLRRTLRRILEEVRGTHPGLPVRFLPNRGGLEVEPWRADRDP